MMSDQKTFVGIEIGGSKLQIVLGDSTLRIIERWRGVVDRPRGAAGIRLQLEAGMRQLLALSPASAIGVGFGGPIDWRSGAIGCSHQIGGWDGFPLAQWLTDITGLPVSADNDANVAALGEAAAGAGVGQSPMFYTNFGSGVGGGLVLDGRIYHGIPPGEVEFGHLRLNRDGQTVESRCSGWAVDARLRSIASAHPQSPLAKLIAEKPGGEARHLAAALAQGDSGASQILAEVADDLAFALSHVVHLFHPAILVLGGGLSQVGEPLRAAIAQRLPGYVMKAFCPAPPVVLAQLSEDAVPVGALRLAAIAAN